MTPVLQRFDLPAQYIIHTVGPVGEKPTLLKSCYWNSLNLAEKQNCKNVVFCCISTGVYGYPQKNAAIVAINSVKEWLNFFPDAKIEKIVFCSFLDKDYQIYKNLLEKE